MAYNLHTNFDDDNDDDTFDSYFNADSVDTTPILGLEEYKPVPSFNQPPTSSFAPADVSQYAGPSFQYEAYRQTTGLPTGSLASTFAVNKAAGLYGNHLNNNFVIPQQVLNLPILENDDFDFSKAPITFDMDGDLTVFGEGVKAFGYSGGGGAAASSVTPMKMYPGMHTEQAQQQQQQQQKKAAINQQPTTALPAGQKSLPVISSNSISSLSPEIYSKIMKEAKSRSSLSASSDNHQDDLDGLQDDIDVKLERDEDDMDEDERLLNSEEGKKLSSKERRQLRNKVSARAFRARRKDYIGQLENDLALKSQESQDKSVQIRQLMEENQRLTDLTRMLLSSKAFAGFLHELGQTGSTEKTAPPLAPGQVQVKDISQQDAGRQLQQQSQGQQQMTTVGMSVMPEIYPDLTAADDGFGGRLLPNNYQVYSLTEIPLPTVALPDMSVLCDKSQSTMLREPSTKALSLIPSDGYQPAAHYVNAGEDLFCEPQRSSSGMTPQIPTRLSFVVAKREIGASVLSAPKRQSSSSSAAAASTTRRLEDSVQLLDGSVERLKQLMGW